MSRLVQFRDLPGGPMEIKFTDEVTRHCLCKSCSMLSLTMYADPASHFFCETCINIQSYKHKKYDIYCPEERRNVSFHELFETQDVITVLRDQYVECPNKRNCNLKLPLEQLENHYIECMQLRSIRCPKCGTEVAASSWNKHKAECKPTYDTEFPSKESDSRHNRPELPPASPFRPGVSASRKTEAAKRTTVAAEVLYPADQLRRMTNRDHGQGPARTKTASLPPYLSDKPRNPSSSESEKLECQYCGRKVKEENMQRHLEKCYDLPIDCPLCHQAISRKDANAHVQNCQQDIEEKSKESKKNEAAKTIRDQPQPRSYPDAHAAYQGSKIIPAEVRGTASGKSPRAVRREAELTSGCYTDGKAWQLYATSGNWYAACVVIEEQFRGTEADQEARCAHFVPKLENLKLDHIVRDLLDDPYEPQHFDCLITALIARCCLPQKIWPQGLQVTWDHILMYVPSVLQGRLTDGARSYLRKHAVYLDYDGPRRIEAVGVEAAEAVIPGDPPPVTSQIPAITEAEARSVKETGIIGATEAKSRDINTILARMQGEKTREPARKSAKRKSVAESLKDVTSKVSHVTASETSTEAESIREGEHLKSRGKPQQTLHAESTSESRPGEAVRSLDELGNNPASSQREASAALPKLTLWSRPETSAPQPSAPSKSDDLSVAEPLPNTEGLREDGYLKSHGEPQQNLHADCTSENQLREAAGLFDRLSNNTASSQRENVTAFYKESSEYQPEPPASEPLAPSKLGDISVTEASSNTERLSDEECFRSQDQTQEKLHVKSTSKIPPGKADMLFGGLANNAASSLRENRTELFTTSSRCQSEPPAPEPQASSKLDDARVTQALLNTEGLRDGMYFRSQDQAQQKLHVESTYESLPGKAARIFEEFRENIAYSQRETGTASYKLHSWKQSEPSAPEPPTASKSDDLSVTDASSNTEGWRDGQPQQNLHVESTSERRPGEAAGLFEGFGDNSAPSQRENGTPLSKPSSWSQPELLAPEHLTPSISVDLSVAKAMSNTEGLRDGKLLRSQWQPQQLGDECTSESQCGRAANSGNGLPNNTAPSQREISTSLDKPSSWRQSEPLATEATEILGKPSTDSKHSSDVKQSFQKTYAEALKQTGATPTTGEGCKIDWNTERGTCSIRLGGHETHQSDLHKTPQTCTKERACSAGPEEGKCGPNCTTRKEERSPSAHEKSKPFLERNGEENANQNYSRTGSTSGKTTPDRFNSHHKRSRPEHHTETQESRSAISVRSDGTSLHQERVIWNSNWHPQYNHIGTVQQCGTVTGFEQTRRASQNTTISRVATERAVQSSLILCDTSNAGTEHTGMVSRMVAPDFDKFLCTSQPSFTRSEESYFSEEGHRNSISKAAQRTHDPWFETPAGGTGSSSREDVPAWEEREAESTTRRVRRPSEEATAITSSPGFAHQENYSAFGAMHQATSNRPNHAVPARGGYQINVPCSQELLSDRPSRAFSCPADIARQGTPDLHFQAAYRSAKSCNHSREQCKEHHDSALQSPESLLDDASFVMETEV